MPSTIRTSDVQSQAVLDELCDQRSGLADRAATLAGELAAANARIALLEAENTLLKSPAAPPAKP